MQRTMTGLIAALALAVSATSALAVSVNTKETTVTAPPGSTATGSLLASLVNFELEWVSGGTVLASTTTSSSLGTTFGAGTETQSFIVRWTCGDGACLSDPAVDIQLNTVPLPAGALLLGTGLAAFGWARRRKAA